MRKEAPEADRMRPSLGDAVQQQQQQRVCFSELAPEPRTRRSHFVCSLYCHHYSTCTRSNDANS